MLKTGIPHRSRDRSERVPGLEVRRRCRALAQAREGATAVEFALLLPLMLLVYLGLAELGRGIQAKRSLAQYARTIADLTGRGTPSDMKPIYEAANLVARPFDSAGIDAQISTVGVYKKGGVYSAIVCSTSRNKGTSVRKVGSAVASDKSHGNTFPDTFKEKMTLANEALENRYILAEVTGTFTPMLGSTLLRVTGLSMSSTLQEVIAWPQRTDDEVVLPQGVACPTVAPT
ncbi:TadE/TadG family type IV pilus assembly protein [Methylobacterium durans]|uniref:TadE/TadG family type IV pilus assembly protein n=1 Tax=Methylobacterium durans TaxID=2202825 RepID=UPI002AFF9D57|nr:TadE/TadG family type IV pilus assembly protein [Methylobacterium durans]MEA1830459.1 TadE/TadG family type IV pilus assembly protein [Methylobacterium durans]